MAALTDRHKEFIIKSLACFDSPSEIQKKVRITFDIELTTSQIVYYDPETSRSRNLAVKWREMFCDIRDRYKEEISQHDISTKGYRLGMLQKAVENLYQKEKYTAMARLLEQAAKEIGGVYEENASNLEDKNTSTHSYIQQIYNRIENGS